MKYLFQINLGIIITNLLLLIIPVFGAWFALFLGFSQLVMIAILAFSFKRFDSTSKIIYLVYLAICLLFFVAAFWEDLWEHREIIRNILVGIPVFLAFLHLYLTFRIRKLSWR